MGSARRLRRDITEAAAALPSRSRPAGPRRASDSDSDEEAWTRAVAGSAPRHTAMSVTAGPDRRRTAVVTTSQAQLAKRAAAATHEFDDSDDDMWKAATATRGQGIARTAKPSLGPASATVVDPEDSDDDMWAAAAAAAPPRSRSASVSAPRSTGQPAAAAQQAASAPQRRSEQPDAPSLRTLTRQAPRLQPRRTAPVYGAQPLLLRQRRATEAAQSAADVPVQRAPLARLRASQQGVVLPYTDPELHVLPQSDAADSAAPKTATPAPERARSDAGMRPPNQTATPLPVAVPADVSTSAPTKTEATGTDALHTALAHEVGVMREAAAVAAHEMTSQLAAIMRTVQPLSQRLRALEDQAAASAEAPASSATAELEHRIAALEAAQAAVDMHASPAPPANALLEERLTVLEAKAAAAAQPAPQKQTPPLLATEACSSIRDAVAIDPLAALRAAPKMAAEAAAESLPRLPLSTPAGIAVKQPVNALPKASTEQPARVQAAHGIAPGQCSGTGAVLCQQGVCACDTRVR